MQRPRKLDKVKASTIQSLLTGAPIREAAERAGVSPTTVKRWKKEAETRMAKKVTDEAEGEFSRKLEQLLIRLLDASTAMAELISDPNYLRNTPVEQVRGMRDIALTTGERLVRLAQGSLQPPESVIPQLPAGPTNAEYEIVD